MCSLTNGIKSYKLLFPNQEISIFDPLLLNGGKVQPEPVNFPLKMQEKPLLLLSDELWFVVKALFTFG